MKLKKYLIILFSLLLCAILSCSLIFSSCKKETASETSTAKIPVTPTLDK
ncbi:MAG: hypothetical protein HQ569_05595, partial [Actinobacteria bacterium]|nr:hypothetical protein [Actinomycetota bacterium]